MQREIATSVRWGATVHRKACRHVRSTSINVGAVRDAGFASMDMAIADPTASTADLS
jgi:hypothetical protein